MTKQQLCHSLRNKH